MNSRLALVALCCILSGISNVYSQVSLPVLNEEGMKVHGIAEAEKVSSALAGPNLTLERQIWIATQLGVYRIDAQGRHRRIESLPAQPTSILGKANYIWVGARDGIYQIDVNTGAVARITQESAVLKDIVAIKNEVWLLTDQKLYRRKDNFDQAEMSWTTAQKPTCIYPFGNEIWIGTEIGIFSLSTESEQPQLIQGSPKEVRGMAVSNGRVFIGTGAGIFTSNSEKQFAEIKDLRSRSPSDLVPVEDSDGLMWFSRADGVIYQVSNVGEKDARVQAATPLSNLPMMSLPPGLKLSAITKVLYTEANVLGNPQRTAVNGDSKLVAPRSYRLTSETFWIVSNNGTYRLQDGRSQRIPDMVLATTDVMKAGGHLWLATETGLYDLDPNLAIDFDVKSEDTWWKSVVERVLPSRFRVSGNVSPNIRYLREDTGNPYQGSLSPKFQVVMEMNETDFTRAQQEGGAPLGWGKQLSWGWTVVYYDVRDQWGNRSTGKLALVVVPGPIIMPILLGVFWVLSLLLIIGFAPRSRFFNNLLMNRGVRKYGYFNVIPVALTVLPPVKHHMLRRYVLKLRHDERFSSLEKRYIIPHEEFTSEKMLSLLKEHQRVLLLGQSGIGKTTYFLYLMSRCLSGTDIVEPNMIPVFLSLSAFKGTDPALLLHTQLASHGRVTDKELTESFLDSGGFLIFVDGLNEIDDEARIKCNSFVELHCNTNYFLISSQENYPDFIAERINLEPLDKEKIEQFLIKRLGDRSTDVIAQMTPDSYEQYKIPLDLELAVEILKENPESVLPLSRHELYEKKLAPLLAQWSVKGNISYGTLLTERAYEMLTERDPFFDRVENPLPSEIKGDLILLKFLIPRGKHLHFRHSSIIDYLAAKHFAANWKDVSTTAVVHSNWRSMLEFAVQELQNDAEVRDLLYFLVGTDPVLAIDVYKFVKTKQTEKSYEWRPEFMRRLGESMVQAHSG